MIRIFLILGCLLLAGCTGNAECADCDANGTNDSTDATANNGTTTQNPTTEHPPANNTTIPAPPASAVPGKAFDLQAAECEELLALIPIDAAVARNHVPANYTLLLDQTGKATALVNIKDCASMTLDGDDQGAGTGADIGVLIDQGEPGVFHYYQIHWMTSSAALAHRLESMGWQVSNSTDTLAASTPGRLATSAGLFGTLDLEAPAVIDGPGNINEAVGYYDGIHGTVTVTKHVDGTGGAFGAGAVTFAATDAIAGLLGANGQGAGVHLAYDLDGRIDYLL